MALAPALSPALMQGNATGSCPGPDPGPIHHRLTAARRLLGQQAHTTKVDTGQGSPQHTAALSTRLRIVRARTPGPLLSLQPEHIVAISSISLC